MGNVKDSSSSFSLDLSNTILVIGAGAMGAGIAQVAAHAGHTVYLYDIAQGAAVKAKDNIKKQLDKLIAKGKWQTQTATDLLEKIYPIDTLEEAKTASLAIEAIVENLEIKHKLFTHLETCLSEKAVLASNTSSLSITALAAPLRRPERFVGIHFFNPPPRMPLVEIVAGLSSDKKVLDAVFNLVKTWGKKPVHVRSSPGFIVNRVARPYYGEAWKVLSEKAIDVATADMVMTQSAGFVMGPFALMDLIGLDIGLAVSQSVYAAFFYDKRYAPSPLQQEMVWGNRLGRKTGIGFYDYREGATKKVPQLLPAKPVAKIHLQNGPKVIESLHTRLEKAGVLSDLSTNATLAFSDGRTATQRSTELNIDNLVLFDLALNYAQSPHLLLTKAQQCSQEAFNGVVGACQGAGFTVSECQDTAGMLVLRTVCMLANEAAEVVLQGIAQAKDVDMAMQYGLNYPQGPLAWVQNVGLSYVVQVLDNLNKHYGEERYRVAPLMRQSAYSPGYFYKV